MNEKNKSEILNVFENFSLDEINEGIEELESTIGKTRFGNIYHEQLDILYTLKSHAIHKNISREVHDLKEQLKNEFLKTMDLEKANVKTFNLWVGYHNQGKGIEFDRDNLQLELDSLIAHE